MNDMDTIYLDNLHDARDLADKMVSMTIQKIERETSDRIREVDKISKTFNCTTCYLEVSDFAEFTKKLAAISEGDIPV